MTAPLHGCTAFGIASFDPLEVDRGSPGRGRITHAPAPARTDADMAGDGTAGTGIGGRALVEDRLGRASRHPADTEFKDVCRFRGDCLEELAGGSVLAQGVVR